MAWNLETARTYLKIDPGDTSKDAVIQQTLDRVLASVETALGRYLLRRRENIVFRGVVSPKTVQVQRYPIRIIHRCVGAGDRDINHEHGTITFINGTCGDVFLDMEGGYEPMPVDLEYAMWQAFLVAWAATDQDTGGPAEDAPTAGDPDVKSLTLYDAFKVDYQVDSSVTSQSLAEEEAAWGWLFPWSSTLAMYRSGPSGAGGLGLASKKNGDRSRRFTLPRQAQPRPAEPRLASHRRAMPRHEYLA